MVYRPVLLVCAVAIASASSCSAPDPAQIIFIERGRSSGESAGGLAEGGAEDAVFGTSTFALGATGPNPPAKAKNPEHMNDASGKDCMACHTGRWAFAGTVYADKTSTMGVPNAEVRITGPDKVEYARTYTDVDGNFWVDVKPQPIPPGSRVGVRTATLKQLMVGVVGTNEKGCSQSGACHGNGGLEGKVFLK